MRNDWSGHGGVVGQGEAEYRNQQLLSLLLALDFDELEDPLNIAQDATQWKFLVNASHEGGVLLNLHSAADIESAFPLIRQAHAASED